MIREHPYIQYFLGYADYQYDLSLDASLSTHFRKRLPSDVIVMNLKKSLRDFLLTFFSSGNKISFGDLSQNTLLGAVIPN